MLVSTKPRKIEQPTLVNLNASYLHDLLKMFMFSLVDIEGREGGGVEGFSWQSSLCIRVFDFLMPHSSKKGERKTNSGLFLRREKIPLVWFEFNLPNLSPVSSVTAQGPTQQQKMVGYSKKM